MVCIDSDDEGQSQNFVKIQSFLHDKGLNVPRIHVHNPELGFLIQEDVGDSSLFHCIQEKNQTSMDLINLYKKAVDQIRALQESPWQDHFLSERSFDLELYERESQKTQEYFLNQEGRHLLKREDLRTLEIFIGELNQDLAPLSTTLCHRDYHSRNLHWYKEKIYLIDFQDALLGHPLYDLVSFLEDCYVELKFSEKEEVKAYAFTQFKHKKFDSQKWEQAYLEIGFQRLFKILGTFSYLNKERGRSEYLIHIPTLLKRIPLLLENMERKGAQEVQAIIQRVKLV